jgi:hypothetical protein
VDKSQADWLVSRLHQGVRLWWPAWWSPRSKTTARIRRRMARRLEGYRWLDFAAALTGWRRHDIELAGSGAAAQHVSGTDIEAAD